MTLTADNIAELAQLPEAHALLDAADCGYLKFQPRPDQPARKDEQAAFLNSRDKGVSWHIGGTGAGTSAMAMLKVAQFVLSVQPPPRFDTPFWIIGEGYEQVIENCWKEKLWGEGMIPASEIQEDRITWHSGAAKRPISVPLKPWPKEKGGHPFRNWVIEFKSYDQGWQKMQARSIGGFCFSEQFPYIMLTEVLARTREYNFPGSKFCEFTPLDPAKSVEIEDMITRDALPKGWAIYRANTLCAKEAGHVNAEWFEEFYGGISDEMFDTRMTGEFASYEGQIYQGFDPRIHCTKPGERIQIPPNCWHRRTIDWGSGPEHPMVCLWACRDGMGRYLVYDEYHSTSQTLTAIDHLVEIYNRHPWPENSTWYGATYADPSRPDMFRLFGAGVAPDPSIKIGVSKARAGPYSVDPGIECVRVHLKQDANGNTKLLIDRDRCPNLCRQMRTYRWKKPTVKGVNPQAPKPEPLKKDDDEVDALRYLLYSEHHAKGGGPIARRVQRDVPKHIGFRRTRR